MHLIMKESLKCMSIYGQCHHMILSQTTLQIQISHAWSLTSNTWNSKSKLQVNIFVILPTFFAFLNVNIVSNEYAICYGQGQEWIVIVSFWLNNGRPITRSLVGYTNNKIHDLVLILICTIKISWD